MSGSLKEDVSDSKVRMAHVDVPVPSDCSDDVVSFICNDTVVAW